MLTPSGAYFLDPGVVLGREEGEWGGELADDTLAKLDRLIADVQGRLTAAERPADTPSSIFDPGDAARDTMDARVSHATVLAPPPEITPPETIDPWKVPVMAGLATEEGQRLHAELVDATATITSDADWLDFVALAGDNLRNVALATDPLTEEQISELYAPRSLEGLNAVARFYAELDNERAPFFADRLRTDQRYGFRSPEMEVTLVERQNADGTATASVWNRELQVGGTGSIQSARSGRFDLDCVTRICDIHTHPLSTRGSNAGLSEGDLDALQGGTERIRAAGSDAEYSVASENLLDNTITMATNQPGETVTEFRVLSPGDLPIPDQIVLGPFTIDTVDLDPDIPTYPPGSTEGFFERMRQTDDAGRAREQARTARDQELFDEFDARLGVTTPSARGTGSTEPSGEPPTGPGVSAPSAPPSVAPPSPRTAPLLPAVPSAGEDEQDADRSQVPGGRAVPDPVEEPGSSPGGVVVGGDLGHPVSLEEAIEAMFPGGDPRRVDPPVVAQESLTPPPQERAEFDPNSINEPGEPVEIPELPGFPTRDPVLDEVLFPNGPAGARHTFPVGAEQAQGSQSSPPATAPGSPSPALSSGPITLRPDSRYPLCSSTVASGCIDPASLRDTNNDLLADNAGRPVLGEGRVGPGIVGPAVVGPAIVGPGIVGEGRVGPAIVGPAIVGPRIVGPAIVGEGRVGPGPVRQAADLLNDNVVQPVAGALGEADRRAQEQLRTTVTGSQPMDGFMGVSGVTRHRVWFMDGGQGVYDPQGRLVTTESGNPPSQVDSTGLYLRGVGGAAPLVPGNRSAPGVPRTAPRFAPI